MNIEMDCSNCLYENIKESGLPCKDCDSGKPTKWVSKE